MPEVITDNLDLWTSALLTKSTAGRGSNGKLEAYGIKKLRELILELAVRGKLVPQDQNDEPASTLLKRIASEKARLVRERKIKPPKSVADIANNEEIFSLPMGWSWARLEQLAPMSLFDGDWIESNDQDPNGAIRLIQLADIGVDEFKDISEKFINEETFEKLSCTELHEGDILIARLPSPIGRACIFPGLPQRAVTAVDVAIFRLFDFAFDRYIVHAINSVAFRNQVEEYGKGATRFRISTGNLKTILVPIPPRAEQHRIVAKVDELMALCDQLEQQQTQSIAAHQNLVETLLGTLTRVESQQEFSAAWARIASHFDTLFTTEASIDQLKQTILQLAVMGKLVPQDSNDEPASVLRERIAAEKGRLIKEGLLKKQQPLANVTDAEISFEIPDKWEWSRLGNIGIGNTGKTPSTGSLQYYGGVIPFIGPGQITQAGEILDSDKNLTEEGCEYSAVAEPGDVLMVCIGGSIGKSAIAVSRVAFNQQINSIRPIFVCPVLLNYSMSTPQFQAAVLAKATGSATPIINRSKWEELLIPLPPLAEQHRIVAKVDELMALCDTLKARLADAQTTQLHLADAIVEQAVC